MAQDYKKLDDYLKEIGNDDFTEPKEEKKEKNNVLDFFFQCVNNHFINYNNKDLHNVENSKDKAHNFLKRYTGFTYDDFLKNSLPKKAIERYYKNELNNEGKDSFSEIACAYIAALSDVEKNGFNLNEFLDELIEQKELGLDLKNKFFLKKGLMYLKDSIKYNIDEANNKKSENFSQQDPIVNMYLAIKQKIQSNKNISIEYNPDNIGLILDKKIGFQGYEDLFVTDTNTGYEIKYFGTLENGLNTFSKEKINNEQINLNPVIYFYTSIKGKSKRMPEKGYNQIVNLKKKGDYDEAVKTLEFVVDRFNDKL
ncbi:MAG: hypothetical protein ACOCQG_04305 [Candidatus Nanoarchaeia archaeon]